MEEFVKKILKIENIVFERIEQSNSGWTNIVFFVDDKYVVKIKGKDTKAEKIQKEIAFYKNVNLPFVPKYISSGNIDGVDYLIIEKLKGQSLYKVWHKLGDFERYEIMFQISQILNQFHTQKFNFLPEKFVQPDWQKKWERAFLNNIKLLKYRGFDTSKIEKFSQTKLKTMFLVTKNALVYNDAHFDNFIYDGKFVKLIDFDRIMFCSVDYELLIIKKMLQNPKKFANSEDEKNVDIKDYSVVEKCLREYSKEMFDFENFDDRLCVYEFFYNLGNGYEYDRNDWIQAEIDRFCTYFDL